MAQKIVLVDDIDGETEAAGVLQFFVDGQEYEADLSEENLDKYTAVMEEYRRVMAELAEYGRPVRRQAPVKVNRGRTKEELNDIRRWARANGHQVNDMGRIPEKIIDLYETRTRMPQKTEEPAQGKSGIDMIREAVNLSGGN